MPALQLEQQLCDWVEKRPEEPDLTFHKYFWMAATASALERSAKVTPRAEPYRRLDLGFWCERHEVNLWQDIWDLAYAARVKVAREDLEEYESERLIEEINEAYDEEMEREDEEFLKHTKGYYSRILNSED
jgi:hypothetical protein